MCGLIGFSGDSNTYDWKKVAALMLINTDRGRDASGFYYPIPSSNKYTIHKSDESFTRDLVYNSALHGKCNLFIGHDRQASSGFKNKENAHPFIYDNEHQVVCAHNGTLTFLYEILGLMRKDFPENEEKFSHQSIDVDSKIFSMYFSLAGVDKYKVLEYYEGAAALLFSDLRNPDVLYAYTDGSRPLHFGYVNKDMYISSEKEPLQFIGCGKKIEHFKHNHVYKIEKGKIISRTKITKKKIVTPTPVHNSARNFTNNFINAYDKDTAKYTIKELRDLLNFAKSIDTRDLPLEYITHATENIRLSADYNLLYSKTARGFNQTRIQKVGSTFLIREWDECEHLLKVEKDRNGITLTKKYIISKEVNNKIDEDKVFKTYSINMKELEKMFILSKENPIDDEDGDILKSEILSKLEDLHSQLDDFLDDCFRSTDSEEMEKSTRSYILSISECKSSLDENDYIDFTNLEIENQNFTKAVKDFRVDYKYVRKISDLFTELESLTGKYAIEND